MTPYNEWQQIMSDTEDAPLFSEQRQTMADASQNADDTVTEEDVPLFGSRWYEVAVRTYRELAGQ